ncbi:S-DNA-T family DNA segregation ATPase FtsK/SpoIIIE [Roseivirga pacifica]|uniref:DNA segregation ATPase FtsK/SpoIIIE, S-DNA-T family n=1 Tax=Roseivirga pacifica TaxID=1267423 RepID=A0A1I0R8X6_9BACT|nr:DNA translocase FtsK [Roseivirga pacifica]RKQ49236.1 S-DNA-T family DNA segregation ATPase FtsK/SpoIIIE [Roseivirga pacifica]SEW37233.1 DNA segregation ATPase FtsK/SpoIIIE, S-DNA-T family [Roseivirga pacifica]
MAKNTYKSNTFKSNQGKTKSKKVRAPKVQLNFLKDRRLQLSVGFFLLLASVFILLACFSYLFTGKADQSVVEAFFDDGQTVKALGQEARNWMKLLGALTAHKLIFAWFGVAAFLIPPLLFIFGYKIVWGKSLISLQRATVFTVFFLLWISLLMGSMSRSGDGVSEWSLYSGGIGYQMSVYFDSLLGFGTILLLAFTLLVFLIFYFNITQVFTLKKATTLTTEKAPVMAEEGQEAPVTSKASEPKSADNESDTEEEPTGDSEEELKNWVVSLKEEQEQQKAASEPEPAREEPETEPAEEPQEIELTTDIGATKEEPESDDGSLELEIEPQTPAPEPRKEAEPAFEVEIKETADKLVEKAGHYDPTLDLAKFQFPTIDLLQEYSTGKINVTKDELQANKDKIVETLTNFKIGISSIKATIGPTITLYEIIPEAGVKISKIKNLEDDIALSLAALGIRIIAPIPGKGTIGIEVPNANKEMVSMRSVISTEKFMNSDKALPVALGKTISNEVYVADLAKMPHLLMAGATGQGKSVGLNAILTSLLYKKHPSQLKFVLVDPKKVELTLFNKIERHYLAKLPDSEDAIITDTKKVIYTLNSLCVEMDQRYDLLKDAACRNIKEYNKKFVDRKLNPEKGHKYLPYIVLVIDELADLMMTAGKEVETPIARLAQLARAIGIHLVVATQRPSVNVITGIIKANFPARLSFRVTSKVDSRTILDAGGADQLIGQGDMLLSMGSEITRMQCAFVDTPEVDEICEFIGSQKGYSSAYMLPEFAGDEGDGGKADMDLSDRDALFEEAARLIVSHQQGSTSLVQRKLKLGYNRAGRIIDQLEAAGIVGPFEGSKAREVLVPDEYSLEQLLNELNNN